MIIGTVEFFDSLGYDLDYYHNSIKKFVQKFSNKHVTILRCRLYVPINSSLCGHYCLYYAYCRCQGMTTKNIVNNFPTAQWIQCSIPLLFDINDIISECQCCEKNF